MSIGTKEKAVLRAIGPAMGMIEGWTKDIKPENEIGKFIEEKYGILLETKSEKVNAMTHLLMKMAIAEANEDPEWVELKFLRFYEAFRVWYKQKQDAEKKLAEEKEKAEFHHSLTPKELRDKESEEKEIIERFKMLKQAVEYEV